MGIITTILLIDSSKGRREKLAGGIAGASTVIAASGPAVTFRSEKAEWSNWRQYHIIVLHNTDLADITGMDLSSDSGPRVIKFGGDGQEEVAGECPTRVYAVYPPIPPDGPYGVFQQSEVWSRILLFVLNPTTEKPPELSARPVAPVILASWLLLRGYALARGFLVHLLPGTLTTDASHRWQNATPSEKKEYWRPLAGGAVALAEARLSRASALIAETQTQVEPEKESVLAAVEEIEEFLRRKGYGQP